MESKYERGPSSSYFWFSPTGFRHIVRNVYTYKFDSARIEKLTERAGPLFAEFRAELLAFADFMESNEVEEEGNNDTHYSVNCKPTRDESESFAESVQIKRKSLTPEQ